MSTSNKSHNQQNLSNDSPPNPLIETNSESRHNNLKSQELQEEQFITSSTASKPKTVYGNALKGETIRESTMSLYDSLNASDHI